MKFLIGPRHPVDVGHSIGGLTNLWTGWQVDRGQTHEGFLGAVGMAGILQLVLSKTQGRKDGKHSGSNNH